jgi:hypothetical protein
MQNSRQQIVKHSWQIMLDRRSRSLLLLLAAAGSSSRRGEPATA